MFLIVLDMRGQFRIVERTHFEIVWYWGQKGHNWRLNYDI